MITSYFLRLIRQIQTYDLWLITSVGLLSLFSLILISSAGSAVALAHNWQTFYFIKKHMLFLLLSISVGIWCATMPNQHIPKLSLGFLILGFIGVILTFFIGAQIKGASRWLSIFGFSIQPSEFMKLGCILMCANLIHNSHTKEALIVFSTCAFTLILQPDFGSLMLLSAIITVLLLAHGLQFKKLFYVLLALIFTGIIGYLTLPHISTRIDVFLNKTDDKFGKNYQINKATEAFKSGGLIGKGPGEGNIKHNLPDSHADFIFAVAGEELGLAGTIAIVILYFICFIRIYLHILKQQHTLQATLVLALGSFFLLHAWFSILSNLALIPTKGFSLPIIGYGGSGLIAHFTAIGLLLNLTKEQVHAKILNKFY